ncbi:MAG TPA: ABC transporter permease [Candidatus Acidoferrales bacterium]|nr:ABC transporter permease [Candidatus Acidoferrales bacterium]
MKQENDNLRVLVKKELLISLKTPAAYVVIIVFLLISGYMFAQNLFLANAATLRPFFSLTTILYLFFIPALTMRTFSEEFRSGTIEIIVTHPVGRGRLVLAKLLSSMITVVAALVPTIIYFVIIAGIGEIDSGTVLAGYLGLIFLSAGYVSAGIFASSLTQNQVAAFIIALFILFIFFILDKVTSLATGQFAYILQYVSSDFHLENFYKGVIDLRDVIYFCGVTVFFSTLTMKWLELRSK